jgi:hypothetical protein
VVGGFLLGDLKSVWVFAMTDALRGDRSLRLSVYLRLALGLWFPWIG